MDMTEFLNALWSTAMELAPWLFLGALISALLHRFLPSDFIAKQLKGYSGIFKAVFLGVPLPLCSCGVIPAGIGLKKDGASDGSSVAFLISTPQTGVDSVLVSAAFLGWPFAIFKLLSAGFTGIVGGVLVEKYSNETVEIDGGHSSTTEKRDWKSAWEHGVQLLRSIWRWLLFGILLSALIQAFLAPEDLPSWINEYSAFFFALIISIPLYICATASVPIAAAMVLGGFPMGAALVFLMAGPATNMATIGAIYKSFGKQNTMFYLGTVVFFSMLLGMSFGFLLEDAKPTMMAGHGHEGLWEPLFGGGLVLFLLYFAWEEIRIHFSQKEKMGSVVYTVEGMSCGGCVSKLQRHFNNLEGVESVVVSLKPGTLSVKSKLTPKEVITRIESAGFKGSLLGK